MEDAMRNGATITLLAGVLTAVRVVNYASIAVLAAFLVASLPFAGLIEDRLVVKYGPALDIVTAMSVIRVLLLSGLVAALVLARLLTTLAAMVGSVRQGDPFVSANAGRLQQIGWLLLTLQVIDLLAGAAGWWLRSAGVDYLAWTPSLIGWVAVLIAFVLARVFSAGTAMRDDLADTV
jgi:hypothetical protein